MKNSSKICWGRKPEINEKKRELVVRRHVHLQVIVSSILTFENAKGF
jgi:hypothetical protein